MGPQNASPFFKNTQVHVIPMKLDLNLTSNSMSGHADIVCPIVCSTPMAM